MLSTVFLRRLHADSSAKGGAFSRLIVDSRGVTAIEYGLIAAGISVAIIAVVNGLGTNLNGVFTNVNTQLR